MASAERVKVVCRVRPWLGNEVAAQISLAAEVGAGVTGQPLPGQTEAQLEQQRGRRGRTVSLRDPAGSSTHRFNFDEVFTAHGQQGEKCGRIYDKHAAELVREAAAGYHCTVLAYGSTGSGKTSCMFGAGIDCAGIVPQALMDTFEAGKGHKNFEVSVSLLEVYNERITDLLASESGSKSPKGLKVREGVDGPYVEDLEQRAVKNPEEAMRVLTAGLAHRAVAPTARNAQSSRSHTVLTVHMRRKDMASGGLMESSLRLVDLAGSERYASASEGPNPGAIAKRQGEGVQINKGLSALGNCVRALARRSAARSKAGGDTPRARAGAGVETHIPYRDSVLTWILKHSLDGHAKVLVIAALAPGTHTFAESLSTLRYADRMQRIETAAVVGRPRGAAVAATAASAAQARQVRKVVHSAPEARAAAAARAKALREEREQRMRRPTSAGSRRQRQQQGDSPPLKRPTRQPQHVSPYALATPAKPSPYAMPPANRRRGAPGQRAQVVSVVHGDDDVELVRGLPSMIFGCAVRSPRVPAPQRPTAPHMHKKQSSPRKNFSLLMQLQRDILSLAAQQGTGQGQASPPRRCQPLPAAERPVVLC